MALTTSPTAETVARAITFSFPLVNDPCGSSVDYIGENPTKFTRSMIINPILIGLKGSIEMRMVAVGD